MEILVNIDGAITPASEGRIPVLDHGFLFGDSIYETLRTYDGRPFLFSRHFARLMHSADKVHILVPLSREAMRERIEETLRAANNPSESRIRIVVTRGVGQLEANPIPCVSPSALLFVAPLVELPAAVYKDGVSVRISSFHRNLELAEVKTGNLLRQVLAVREAREAGAFEAILLTPDSYISDGISSNIYLVRGNRLLTPSRAAGIVEGITRSVVLALAVREGLAVEEGLFSLDEINLADEMFLTSTTREVVPIVRVDDRTVGSGRPGPVTLRLLEAYRREVRALLAED